MLSLSNSQRSYLRSLANPLKPVVMIGKHGLSEQVFTKIAQELDDHELIKVKFLEFKDEKKELAHSIAEQARAALVGLIGNIAIFYRESSDPDRRTIVLPN